MALLLLLGNIFFLFQLLNSRREPFFSDSPLAMADIIANTLKVALLNFIRPPPQAVTFRRMTIPSPCPQASPPSCPPGPCRFFSRLLRLPYEHMIIQVPPEIKIKNSVGEIDSDSDID